MDNIRHFIHHPIRIRVLYDLGIALVVLMAIWGSFTFTGQPSFVLWEGLSASIVVVALNQLLGLYGWQKMSSALIKSILVGLSIFATFTFYAVVLNSSLAMILAAIFVYLLQILPRIIFNQPLLPQSHKLNQGFRYINWAKMPILVVGGGGYIGSHLVEQLLSKGYKVRVLDPFMYGRDVLKDLETDPNLEIIEGDVTDIFRLTVALQDVRAVVHLAGIVGDPACALDEDLTQHVNNVSTRILKEAVKAFGIPRFIFASSCSVYGANDDVVHEGSSLNPVSLYAKTKIDSERELLQDPYDGFHPTVLRFATVFGHSRRMRFDLVTNLFSAQAYHQGEVTISGAQNWRPFVHVADVARAIVLTLEAPVDQVSRQIFNVGDDSLNATIMNVAEKVHVLVKPKQKRKHAKMTVMEQVIDRRNYHVSFEKIRKVLGFKAHHSLEAGISEMYRHMQKGTYTQAYQSKIYSNLEMTKFLQTKFKTPEYKAHHFSLLSQAN